MSDQFFRTASRFPPFEELKPGDSWETEDDYKPARYTATFPVVRGFNSSGELLLLDYCNSKGKKRRDGSITAHIYYHGWDTGYYRNFKPGPGVESTEEALKLSALPGEISLGQIWEAKFNLSWLSSEQSWVIANAEDASILRDSQWEVIDLDKDQVVLSCVSSPDSYTNLDYDVSEDQLLEFFDLIVDVEVDIPEEALKFSAILPNYPKTLPSPTIVDDVEVRPPQVTFGPPSSEPQIDPRTPDHVLLPLAAPALQVQEKGIKPGDLISYTPGDETIAYCEVTEVAAGSGTGQVIVTGWWSLHKGDANPRDGVMSYVSGSPGSFKKIGEEPELTEESLKFSMTLDGTKARLSALGWDGALTEEGGIRWPGADLSEAALPQARLRGAKLQGAHLQWAKLQGAHLRGADLRGADLQGADLWEADLRGAKLQGAALWEADLQGAQLQGAEADFSTQWPEGFNPGARGVVMGLEITEESLKFSMTLDGTKARLSALGWDGALTEEGGIRWPGAHLQGAQLRGADLKGADLGKADLQGAKLQGADLQGAGLWGAQLQGADLWKANLQGANLRGAEADFSTQWPEGFNPGARGVVMGLEITEEALKFSTIEGTLQKIIRQLHLSCLKYLPGEIEKMEEQREKFRQSLRKKLTFKKRGQAPTYQKPVVAPKPGFKWVWDPEKGQWEQVLVASSPAAPAAPFVTTASLSLAGVLKLS